MTGDLNIVALKPPATDLVPQDRSASRGPTRAPSRQLTRQDQQAGELEAHSAPEPEQLEALRLKRLLTDPSVQVSTHHDDASGRVVLQVQQRATGHVVEQIPSDRLLKLYATMRESLVDERA